MKQRAQSENSSEAVFSVRFPAVVEFVVPLRKAFSAFLEVKKVSHDIAYMLTLGLSEAVINVIEHTYRFDPSKWIVVEWHLEEAGEKRELIVTIRDFGEKVDPSCLVPRPLEDLKDHGLGLHLIRKTYDSVEFDHTVSEGNLLGLVKRF